MMYERLHLLVAAAILSLSACATTPGASGPTTLPGSWTVVSGEHGGNTMEGIAGGTLTIDGDRFTIRTASGNALQGRIELQTGVRPMQMDMIHDNGTRWIAIYALENGRLLLNYVNAALGEPRPTEFRTTAATEASVLILQPTGAR